MAEESPVYIRTAPRSLAPAEGEVNTPAAYDEIFHRLRRFPNLTDDQRDAFALSLDAVLVDQISDTELAGIVSGDLPNYPLRPGGGQSLGLPGAQETSRYVGATVSGAPATGSFRLGDFVIAQDGHVWVCTVAGSPGTWTDVALADLVATPDASTTVKGLVKLAGDLAGTATAPTVPGLTGKLTKPGSGLDGKLTKWDNTAGQLVDGSSAVTALGNGSFAPLAGGTSDFRTGALGVGAAIPTTHQLFVQAVTGSARNGVRVLNDAASYALKVDQSGTDGVHDAMNVAANFTGAHTPFSVNSNNTTLSTVKIVNAAAQTGGAVIVGVGSSASRTAQIIQADNYGSGASMLATQEAGSTGPAFQVQYIDDGSGTSTWSSRAMWIAGHHTSGSMIYLENDKAQTSGNLMQLVQNNASSTVPCLEISPFGSGSTGLKINTSGASNLIVAGNFSVDSNGSARTPKLLNTVSFSNAEIDLNTTGTVIKRAVTDANAVLNVSNASGTSTGDVLQISGIGGTLNSRFDRNGYFMTRKTTVPADSDVVSGELALWFDSTSGAAKVMWKGKDAGGTVRTGSLALT